MNCYQVQYTSSVSLMDVTSLIEYNIKDRHQWFTATLEKRRYLDL